MPLSDRLVFSADYNLRILWPLARYIQDTHGMATLTRMAEAAAIVVEDLDGQNIWASRYHFETFLKEARTLFFDDESFKQANAYRIQEAYGPMRYVLWAMSPAMVYHQAVNTHHLVTSVAQGKVIELSPNSQHIAFVHTAPIHRLICLARQAHAVVLPTLWGLPQAVLREEACAAQGDTHCAYHLEWNEPKQQVRPAFVGAAVGSVLSAVAALSRAVPTQYHLPLPVLGGAFGYVYEAYQSYQKRKAASIEMRNALQELCEQYLELREELIEVYRKQDNQHHYFKVVFDQQTSKLAQVMNHLRTHQEEVIREQNKYSNVIPLNKWRPKQ